MYYIIDLFTNNYATATVASLDSHFLNGLLDALDAVFLLQLLYEGIVKLYIHGSKDTSVGDSAVKDLLDGNTTWNTDELSHRGVATGDTIVNKGGGTGFLRWD